jgi:hypothetical protein
MKRQATFQSLPNGFWVVAELLKGKLTLSHRHSLEEELDLHKENIEKEEYPKEDIEKSYIETEEWCKNHSGKRFDDEVECKAWLEKHVTNEDVYWEEVR